MQKSLIIFFLFACFQRLSAQPIFENDEKFKPFFKRAYNNINSKFQIKNNANFEYRFWAVRGLDMTYVLFILTQKDNKWNIRCFNNGWGSDIRSNDKYGLKEIKAADTNLIQLVTLLENNDFLQIPDQRSLKDSLGNRAEVAVADGELYIFDVISKKNKRSYSYHCPDAGIKEYPYIRSYEQVINIIKAIFKYYKLNDALYLPQ